MATKKSAQSLHTKKQLKKELASKIESALPEIEESIGKKKFNKRLKKATRLLIKGVHLNGTDKIKAPKKNIQPKKKGAVKKQADQDKNSLH